MSLTLQRDHRLKKKCTENIRTTAEYVRNLRYYLTRNAGNLLQSENVGSYIGISM